MSPLHVSTLPGVKRALESNFVIKHVYTELMTKQYIG